MRKREERERETKMRRNERAVRQEISFSAPATTSAAVYGADVLKNVQPSEP